MANVCTFDTLAYARRRKEAGVDDAQAEAHAEAVRDAVTEGFATKAGLFKVALGVVVAQTTLTVALIELIGGAS